MWQGTKRDQSASRAARKSGIKSYINCADPFSSLSGGERPPFASDLGGAALPKTGGSDRTDGGDEESKKDNADKREEGSHL